MNTKPITCAIVDDEPLAVKLLEKFVGQTPFLHLQASFTDALQALQYLKENAVDLLFLDIEMPEMDGMELARLTDKQTRIVFTTAYKDYALESYEVSALDYLLKPIRYVKFLAAAEKAQEWFDMKLKDKERTYNKRREEGEEPVEKSPKFKAQSSNLNVQSSKSFKFLRVDGERVRVDFSRIIYVEGMKDYVRIHLEGDRVPLTTHLTMTAMEEMLPADRFLRIHRSYIVAKDKIERIDRTNCVYIGGEAIHVTQNYIDALEAYLRA